MRKSPAIRRDPCGSRLPIRFRPGRPDAQAEYIVGLDEFIHNRIEEVLAHLSSTEEQIAKIAAYAREGLRETTSYRTESIKGKERDLKEMRRKIEKLANSSDLSTVKTPYLSGY